VRVLGVDNAWIAVRGQVQGMIVAVDVGRGVPVAVAHVDEKDPAAVTAWLAPLAERLGVEVIVTDDLASYKAVADQVGVDQQVCLFHLRRWAGRAVQTLRAQLAAPWQPILDQIQGLVRGPYRPMVATGCWPCGSNCRRLAR
jgi:transposase-like protein